MKQLSNDRKKTLVFHYLKEGDPSKNAELRHTHSHFPSEKYNNERFHVLRYAKKL